MATEKNEINTMIDIENLRNTIRMDLLQEKHWDVQQDHWLQQQKYWRWVFVLGLIAVIVNALKSLWS